MEKEIKHGKMEQSMKGVGKITNNMARVHIQIKMGNLKVVFGMMENEKKRLIKIKKTI